MSNMFTKAIKDLFTPSVFNMNIKEFRQSILGSKFRDFNINPNVSDSDEKTEITIDLPDFIEKHNVSVVFKDNVLSVHIKRNTVNKKQNSRKSYSYCYSYNPQNAQNKKNVELKFDNNVATVVLT